ncbi:hypothetical protein [Brevundimonas sp. R86498]|uniref:hypothetical protein n=1 Tax=Brevundimonas sp. R86498 TaxID=3093845 RepID=UPI0037C9093D
MTVVRTMVAAFAATLLTGPALAQSSARGGPVEAPVLPGGTADATCGNLYGMAGQAFCVTAPLAAIGALAEVYVAHFEADGWIPAAGDDNRVVFVKRLPGGGCEGMQLQAFYDTNRPAGPEAPGYIGMATIPGDVCAAAAPATTPAPPASPSAQ